METLTKFKWGFVAFAMVVFIALSSQAQDTGDGVGGWYIDIAFGSSSGELLDRNVKAILKESQKNDGLVGGFKLLGVSPNTETNPPPRDIKEESDMSYSIIFGYEFMDGVSTELGYVSLGEFETAIQAYVSGDGNLALAEAPVETSAQVTLAEKQNVDGWVLGLKGSYGIVGDRLDIFGRTGLLFWSGEPKLTATGNAATLAFDEITQRDINTKLEENITAATEADEPYREGKKSGTEFYLGLGLVYMLTEKIGVGADATRYFLEEKIDVYGARFIYKF